MGPRRAVTGAKPNYVLKLKPQGQIKAGEKKVQDGVSGRWGGGSPAH